MLIAPKPKQRFAGKVLIAAAIIAAVILFFLLFYYAIDVILSLFAGVLMAIFFRKLGNKLSHYTNLPITVSVIFVAFLLIGILGWGAWTLAPKVADQIMNLRGEFPLVMETVRTRLAAYNWGRLILEQIPEWDTIIDTVISGAFLRRIGGFFSTGVGIFVNFIIVVLVAIYLAIEPKTYIEGFIKLFPFERRERMREVIYVIGDTLFWWLLGRFAAMILIGILITLGLMYLNVPLALTLGIIAALFDFIPNFGPILSVIPAALIALAESPTTALYVVILYVVIQFMESYLITPLINKKTIELPPVLTIVFQILLGVLIGGLGLILASPILAVIIVSVKMLYIEDVLGDKAEVPVEIPDIEAEKEKEESEN